MRPIGRRAGRACAPSTPPGPDLVVLDIGLPTLDGWAVLERIRDLSDVPVLILTAHGTEADKVRGLHGGRRRLPDQAVRQRASCCPGARRCCGGRGPARRAGRGLRRRPPAGASWTRGEVSVDGAPVSADPDRVPAAGRAGPASAARPCRPISCSSWPGTTRWASGPDRVKFGVMRLRRKLGQHGGSRAPSRRCAASATGTCRLATTQCNPASRTADLGQAGHDNLRTWRSRQAAATWAVSTEAASTG